MKHMKIGMRLALGFGAVILLVVAMAGMGLTRLAEMHRITEAIITKDWQKTVLVMAFFTLAESTRAQVPSLPASARARLNPFSGRSAGRL